VAKAAVLVHGGENPNVTVVVPGLLSGFPGDTEEKVIDLGSGSAMAAGPENRANGH
jgi:hypothetical protein